MSEEEEIKLVCGMAASMFPEIYKNRRAISHDTYEEIVELTARTAVYLYTSTYQCLKAESEQYG